MTIYDALGKPIEPGTPVIIPCIYLSQTGVLMNEMPQIRLNLKYPFPNGTSTFVSVFGGMVVIDK